MTPPTVAKRPDLRAYAENLSRSHAGWLVSLGTQETFHVLDQPLRRLVFENDDLVVEFGAGPGRASRHVIAGPFELETKRRGLDLELRFQVAGLTQQLQLSRPTAPTARAS